MTCKVKKPTLFLLILFSFVCYSLRLVQGFILQPPQSLTAIGTTKSIILTWTQSIQTVVEQRYVITYTYAVRGCPEISSPVTVLANCSSNRNHNITIEKSPKTPIEEDSAYNISLFAVNGAGNESSIVSTVIHTPQAAPSGSPQSVQITSVSLFSATIQWERVDCELRNGRIYGYRVSYYPTADSGETRGTVLVGTSINSRTLTISRLQPRTSYTFVVMAINLAILTFGPAATITFHTSVPDKITLALKGQLYGNNSIVTVSDIGEDVHSALLCITNNLDCCESNESTDMTGAWYLPNGRPVDSSDSTFSQTKGLSVLLLFRRGTATTPSGVFQCHVPDANATLQSVFVGVYLSNSGSPSIVSLALNPQDSSLVCVSTGGPATIVIWTRDGVILRNDSAELQQIQRVVGMETATYENKLITSHLVGNFTCMVINSRGSTERSLLLNGPPLVVDVESFCSVVVWSNPHLPCEEISGYEVRLYDPDSGQEVNHRVPNFVAHYTLTDADSIQIGLDKAYVQVRVLHSSFGPRKWSETISLGCNADPKYKGIHFVHDGQIYPNNSKIALCIIGEDDSALICKTDFVSCCRNPPNRFGKFFYPNGIQVSIRNRGHAFYRDRGEQEIRLHKREGVVTPVGRFSCEIPDSEGELQTIYIELV